jgi:hypothetical protein
MGAMHTNPRDDKHVNSQAISKMEKQNKLRSTEHSVQVLWDVCFPVSDSQDFKKKYAIFIFRVKQSSAAQLLKIKASRHEP